MGLDKSFSLEGASACLVFPSDSAGSRNCLERPQKPGMVVRGHSLVASRAGLLQAGARQVGVGEIPALQAWRGPPGQDAPSFAHGLLEAHQVSDSLLKFREVCAEYVLFLFCFSFSLLLKGTNIIFLKRYAPSW